MLKVPVLDLRAHHVPIQAEVLAALREVYESGQFVLGPAVASFENNFAEYCTTKHCVAVNSGTSALHLAMRCLDIGPGDEVVTVPMTFVATAWPILYVGARPVFVDIDEGRYTMDPKMLETAVTSKTKAVVPVHLYGQCADMDPILEIARARGIPVIEDCAQAHGAEYKRRRAGSMGAIGCFSFYPSKNLGGCGEGGALTTNDPEIAARARRLRDHAQKERYVHEEVGYNYRMHGFQGAVLRVKLKYLDAWIEGRQSAAAQYDRLLVDDNVITPSPCPDGRHVYHLYVIGDSQREALQAHLKKRSVATGLHYPIPVHLQAPFRAFGYKEGDFPVTEELAKTCVSLPMYPELSSQQIQQVVEAIWSAGR